MTQRAAAQVDQFNADLQASGTWVFAGGLHPPASVTVVRAASGAVSMTDGPYAEPDRTRWGRGLIAEGHALLRACLRRNQPGPFQLQAAIAAVHADASTAGATDWGQIVALYDQLLAHRPNPVVAMNPAVAVGELRDPAEGLAELEAVGDELAEYQPFHAARADLLAGAGRGGEAVAAYDAALRLTTNPAERRFLLAQRRLVAPG